MKCKRYNGVNRAVWKPKGFNAFEWKQARTQLFFIICIVSWKMQTTVPKAEEREIPFCCLSTHFMLSIGKCGLIIKQFSKAKVILPDFPGQNCSLNGICGERNGMGATSLGNTLRYQHQPLTG